MQAVLSIGPDDIDERLLAVIRQLLSLNVEIMLKTAGLELEEFDSSVPLDEVVSAFQNAGYSKGFIDDLRNGLAASPVYGG